MDNSSEDHFRSSFGHCMYNYITGLLLSKKLGMEFIHTNFTNSTSRFNSLLNLHSLFKSQDNIDNIDIIQVSPLIVICWLPPARI